MTSSSRKTIDIWQVHPNCIIFTLCYSLSAVLCIDAAKQMLLPLALRWKSKEKRALRSFIGQHLLYMSTSHLCDKCQAFPLNVSILITDWRWWSLGIEAIEVI